jgi:phosphatidylethanolamine-binding protein (PEBP) family uncharacterized protein
MDVLEWIRYTLGRLLYNVRGRDHGVFTKRSACKDIESTIRLLAPECGTFGSQMLKRHTGFGSDAFPELEWTAPEKVKEYVLVAQDPDVPLPFVATHALFYAIPGSVTSIKPADVQYKKGFESQHELVGPFLLGKNTPGTVYCGPKPVLGHGPHRYFFQLVALSEPLDHGSLGNRPSLSAISRAIEGKVLDWGLWIGTWEHKWDQVRKGMRITPDTINKNQKIACQPRSCARSPPTTGPSAGPAWGAIDM